MQGDLYDPTVLRTIFINFENEDWEQELEFFHNSDVDVPATVTVDGKSLPNCGIRFRGASSYGHVPTGYKRSLNVSVDMVNEDQRLLGYKTLNLLNGHGDDSMLSTLLYSHVARQYMPAPKANLVRVVINGEYWGVYTNVQQFNKQFVEENYGSTKGARWKVNGSPRGGGGLDYRGDDPARYGHPYEQKSGGKKSLAKLIEFCRVLDETPTEDLPDALEPICDVDELLWFLALDVGLMNSDGYWVRASDYSIYLAKDDKFHFIPHDMNEAFRPSRGGPGGPGGRGRGGPGRGGPDFGGRGRGGPEFDGPGRGGPDHGGPDRGGPDRGGPDRGGPDRGGPDRGGPDRGGPDFGGPGRGGPGGGPGRGGPGGGPDFDGRGRGGPPEGDRFGGRGGGPQGGRGGPGTDAPTGLDPLISMDDSQKPLRSKVLAVPQYREQYLKNLKTLAESISWKTLGPVITSQAKLIGPSVKIETRGLSAYDDFVATTSAEAQQRDEEQRRGPPRMPLKDWTEGRHKFLVDYQPKAGK